MSKANIWLAAFLVMFAAKIATAQDFLSYEGRDSVHEGQGGERKTVNGIDFWMRGDPPRRYQVIGSLTDERHKTGLWGAIVMSGLDSDIAKAAKKAGGDAVILDGEQDQVTGRTGSVFGNSSGSINGNVSGGSFNASGSSFGSAFGISRDIKEHDSCYIVVRYLADAPPPATSSATSPPQNAPTPGNGP